MIFTTYTFLVFFILTITAYALTPKSAKPFTLIAAGFVFYAYSSFYYFLMLLGLTVFVYLMARSRLKPAMLTGIVVVVGVLFFFKYWKMAVLTWNGNLAPYFRYDLPMLHIVVPLAISFFVFEFVHYLADIYKGKAKQESWKGFFVFIFFFPTLVAGPIKRIQHFEEEKFHFSWCNIEEGMIRMTVGLFKKVILADSIDPMFVYAFQHPLHYSQTGLWVAMYAYGFKIYLDFSAYSDIAIGAAKCLGYHIPENFNWPYISRNLTEFWRRWHISLSTWIRDYVYIPMGGNRKGYIRMLVFVFLAMTISGLWHGANWTFVLWGAWHGVGQVIQKLWERVTKKKRFLPKGLSAAWRWLLTFNFVSLGWVLFESPDILHSVHFYLHMFGGMS